MAYSEQRKDGGDGRLLGIKYFATFIVDTAVWINNEGGLNAKAETLFQLTTAFALGLGASTESEWDATFEYRISPRWSLAVNANDVSGVGVGCTATFQVKLIQSQNPKDSFY